MNFRASRDASPCATSCTLMLHLSHCADLLFRHRHNFGVAFGQNGVALASFRRRFEPESDARMRHVARSLLVEHFGHLRKFLGLSENSADRHRRAGRAPRLAVSCRQHRAFESHPLRQSRQLGHSFSAPDPRSESRRLRPFPANCPNHEGRPGDPFRAVLRLSRPTFSDATEPRPFWYGCRKLDNSTGCRAPEGERV